MTYVVQSKILQSRARLILNFEMLTLLLLQYIPIYVGPSLTFNSITMVPMDMTLGAWTGFNQSWGVGHKFNPFRTRGLIHIRSSHTLEYDLHVSGSK